MRMEIGSALGSTSATWGSEVRRWTLWVSAVCLAFLSGGCLQSDTLVRVHEDGSGEIEVVTLISEETAEQAREMAAAFAPEGEEPEEPDLFPVADLEEGAAGFGEGVRFVRSEPVTRDGFVGVRAIYEFDDVRKIEVSANPGDSGGGLGGMDGGMESMEGEGGEESEVEEFVTFDLVSAGGDHSLLSIHLPEREFEEPDASTSSGDESGGESSDGSLLEDELPSEEELAFISTFLGGFRFSLVVETVGSIVRTNSPHVEGNRVTLYDVDFGRLIEDLPKFAEFAGRGEPESMAEAAEWLQEFEGVKVHLEDELEIEFVGK